jgi:hypothetical protein
MTSGVSNRSDTITPIDINKDTRKAGVFKALHEESTKQE